MKKTIKKVIPFALALSMLSSVAMPVFADEEADNIYNEASVESMFESLGLTYSDDITEEDKQAFYDTMIEMFEKDGYKASIYNCEYIPFTTCLLSGWTGDICYLGEKYDEYVNYMIYNNEAYITGINNKKCDITEYTIPNEIDGYPVVAICGGAFLNAKQLKSITIPNSVRVIGSYAFESLPLENINMAEPNKHSDLQIIGYYAFSGNHNLKEVTCFADSDLNIIAGEAFSGASNLSRFDFPNNKIQMDFYKNQFYYTKMNEGNLVIPSNMMESALEQADEFYEKGLVYFVPTANHEEDLKILGEISYEQVRYEYAFQLLCQDLGYCWEWSPLIDDELDYLSGDITFSDYSFIKSHGDIDYDGEVGIKDLGILKQYLTGQIKLSQIQRAIASTNGEAEPDIRDVTKMNQYLVKTIDKL